MTQFQHCKIPLAIALMMGLPFVGCKTFGHAFNESTTRFSNEEIDEAEPVSQIAAQISAARSALRPAKQDPLAERIPAINTEADKAVHVSAEENDPLQRPARLMILDNAQRESAKPSSESFAITQADKARESVLESDSRPKPNSVADEQSAAETAEAEVQDADGKTDDARANTTDLPQSDTNVLPIDLANALGIAGANNLNIQFARERVIEAHATYRKAKVSWLPSIRLGLAFNRHDGQIQQTGGTMIEADRNSLYVGGGLGLGNIPIQGGAGGPARLFVNLSLADTIFNPLIEKNRLGYTQQNELTVTNETLLAVALAYFDLVEAHGQLANARVAGDAVNELVTMVSAFEKAGVKSSKADVNIATAEAAAIERLAANLERVAVAKSARLKRLMRYDPGATLQPADIAVVPLSVYEESLDLEQLISDGLTHRNEVHQQQYAAMASEETLQRENWRPLLPNVQLGASGGMFGGGESTQFSEAARGDLEVLAVWELENMGYGNRFAKQQAASRVRQSHHQVESAQDLIVEEITVAANNVQSYRDQLEIAERAVKAAVKAYDLYRERIRGGEGSPIETMQAARAHIDALNAYTTAVSMYNKSQFQLIRAVGRVPGK